MNSERAAFVGGYFLFALFICFPAPFHGDLMGHPDVDVWNHVWGYWFFLDSIFSGSLPWRTELLNAPDGGVLYFVDPVGAAAAMPFSALFGVGFAYTSIQIVRVCLAGMMGHLFCREVSGKGPHCWLAGIAFASSPFLLAEMSNGISEVTAIWWTGLCFWRAARAFSTGLTRDWVLLGMAQGLCTLASFYYGLGTALLIGVWFLWTRPFSNPKGILAASLSALLVPLPFFAAFKASLGPGNPEALIQRSPDLNLQLLEHNAVDPREYFLPGDFQSVDFVASYGEAFVHTAYLRWSLILLAAFAVWRFGRKACALWIALVMFSLVLGLGRALFWKGGFVGPGESMLLLPFGWLQEIVPQLAITHSSRLSLGAQLIVAMLAGWALVGLSRRQVALVASIVVAESLFLSAASWPLPTASAEVPPVYREIAESTDSRGVLDLPAEVGTTMASSRYFWFQTIHGKPLPYSPDIRVGSSSDSKVFRWLQHPMGPQSQRSASRVERSLESAIKEHLAMRYGWVIYHEDLAFRAGVEPDFSQALVRVLGPPDRQGSLWIWRL